jgi:hypothetical protein
VAVDEALAEPEAARRKRVAREDELVAGASWDAIAGEMLRRIEEALGARAGR